jgi:hypothetical protein
VWDTQRFITLQETIRNYTNYVYLEGERDRYGIKPKTQEAKVSGRTKYVN